MQVTLCKSHCLSNNPVQQPDAKIGKRPSRPASSAQSLVLSHAHSVERAFILLVMSKQSDQIWLHGYFILPSHSIPQHRLKQLPNRVSALDQHPQAAEHTGEVRSAPQVGASVAALSVVERVVGDSGGEVREGEDVDGSGGESGEVGSELKIWKRSDAGVSGYPVGTIRE
jgi:hypothetical protein